MAVNSKLLIHILSPLRQTKAADLIDKVLRVGHIEGRDYKGTGLSRTDHYARIYRLEELGILQRVQTGEPAGWQTWRPGPEAFHRWILDPETILSKMQEIEDLRQEILKIQEGQD